MHSSSFTNGEVMVTCVFLLMFYIFMIKSYKFVMGIQRDAEPTQHTETIQRQFKTGVPQRAVLHSHYITFKLQTYHHPEHRVWSWHTQMTSKLIYSTHIHTISVHAHKPLLIIQIRHYKFQESSGFLEF